MKEIYVNSIPMEHILQCKNFYREKGYPTFEVMHEGQTFHPFVLPSSLSTLRNFVQRITPTTVEMQSASNVDDVTVFGVSEEVPEEFRPYCVVHEIIEFLHLGIERKGRCALAAAQEYRLVVESGKFSATQLMEYATLRRNFFRDLIQFVEGTSSYTPDDITEFKCSLNYFDSVLPQST